MAQSIAVKKVPIAQRMAIVSQLREAIRREPRNAQYHLDLANLLGEEKNFIEATDYAKRALSIRKKDPETLRRLIFFLFEQHRYVEAKKYGRKLCQVEPRNPQNFKSFGLVQEYSGNPSAAIDAYKKADRLEKGDAATLHDIGRCYGLTGEFDQARKYYEAALDADPEFALAIYSLSTLKKFTVETAGPFVEQVSKATNKNLDERSTAIIHYAAGKALDDAGQFEDAFSWFAKANEIRGPKTPPDLVLQFENTLEAFSPDFVKSRGSVGLETMQPVFIFGLPRSGTTLVESLCGAHSMITAGDEQMFMGIISKRLGRESGTAGTYAKRIHNLKGSQIRDLANEYLELSKGIAGTTPHFTDKLPHNFLNIGLITLLFPNAKLIHCRRHPLDNCFSLYSNSMQSFHNKYKSDLSSLGIYYRQYAKLMDHWRELFPSRMHEVFYEDVIVNTEQNARAAIEYLGLDWEDGVMDRNKSQKSVRTLSGWQVRQPIYSTSKGRWRNYETHLQPLIDVLGSQVQHYEEQLQALDAGR